MTDEKGHDVYETVSFTALPPGWRNVYKNDDGSLEAYPCPGILVRERRERYVSWTEPDGKGGTRYRDREEKFDPPYETRAECASIEYGTLTPAWETPGYVETISPDQTPEDIR